MDRVQRRCNEIDGGGGGELLRGASVGTGRGTAACSGCAPGTELRCATRGRSARASTRFRVRPRGNGRQQVELCEIVTEPPTEVHRHVDAFGNEVAWFQIEGPHGGLVVDAHAIVTVTPHPPMPPRAPWGLLHDRDLQDRMSDYLAPSALVHWPESVDYFAQGLEVDEIDDVGLWLRAMERKVNESIRYERGSTGVDHRGTPHPGAARRVPGHGAPVPRPLPPPRRARPLRGGWLFQPGRDEPGESHAWCDDGRRAPGGWSSTPRTPSTWITTSASGWAATTTTCRRSAAPTWGPPPRRWWSPSRSVTSACRRNSGGLTRDPRRRGRASPSGRRQGHPSRCFQNTTVSQRAPSGSSAYPGITRSGSSRRVRRGAPRRRSRCRAPGRCGRRPPRPARPRP